MNTTNHQAILLIGPTGSGKTPFGDFMTRYRLNGKTCFHFDFGASLRKAAAREKFHDLLSQNDILFLEKVLQEGALLEKETFYIAENILDAFITGHQMTEADILVLNGLPRHIDQARDVEKTIAIRMMIQLKCEPEVVYERILKNTGLDRKDRNDDSLKEIRKKLAIFNARTLPLIDYFRDKNAKVVSVDVDVNTTPEMIARQIQSDGVFFESPI
ncbi:MAG: nucleoside monophosphate kinase [Proteobacteria bacterium]|nr:nucleoside monophosphate kinase [Pseudomonadota bacterium]